MKPNNGTIDSEMLRAAGRMLLLFEVVLVALVAATILGTKPAGASTTFTVTETGDDGDINLSNARCDGSTDTGDQCTLRAAIEEANDTAGADAIDFDIGTGTGAKTISPASELPAITEAVTIDGYTQPGAGENTLEEDNDADLKVQLDGAAAGVGAAGLRIEAPDCTIEGLVIKSFDAFGVMIEGAGATGNTVKDNFVGVGSDGINDQGNSIGVYISGDSNTVGGDRPEKRNVISGNDYYGVSISGIAAVDNSVEGNFIGTTADGTEALGNTEGGVSVSGADDTTVGGTAAGAGNVISGNDGYGVSVSGFGVGATESRIEGNFIGTKADGSGNLGNVLDGVSVVDADSVAIGGTLPGAPNRIARNGEDGVSIFGGFGPDTEGANILSNSIFGNGGLGIDLEGGTEDADGVTDNDASDPDTGSNALQNFPTIIMATKSNSTGLTTISGRLNSTPTQDFVVQCFLTDGAPYTDHGEGSLLLDTDPISTNADGRASFSCESPRSLLGQRPGQTVSATATNVATGDTSEFSKNKAISTFP